MKKVLMDRSKSRMETTTVMFVPSTKGGQLLKMLKEKEEILIEFTDFRVKFIEAGVSPIS